MNDEQTYLSFKGKHLIRVRLGVLFFVALAILLTASLNPLREVASKCYWLFRGELELFCLWVETSDRDFMLVETVQPAPKIITHAGGAICGLIYTNTKQALEHSYSMEERFFELDFQWT